MKRRVLFVLIPLLLAGAVALWFLLSRSDERQIRLLLLRAAETVTKSSGETPAVSAMKSGRCRKIFADSFSFASDSPAWEGRSITSSEAAALLFRMRRHCESLQTEIEVETIQREKGEAAATVLCRIRGSSPAARGDFDEVRRVRVTLQKQENSWKIISAEFSLILQK